MGSLRRASRSLHDHRIVALAVLVGALTGLSVAAFERVVRGGIIDRLLDAPLAVQVVTPSHLDPKARALVQELAKRTRPAPPHLAEFHPGLFSKLRGKFKR